MTTSNEPISSSIYLVDYFIYCPLLCQKEGQEHQKILYYYPSDVEFNRQTRTVGYCEGLVKFTETFAFNDPCDCVHFQKTRLLFYQVENDICIAMTLHVPSIERKKDEKLIMEYYDEHINDRLMLSVLKISYRYFVLEHGTIASLIQVNGVDQCRIILKKYFDKFIAYRLHAMILDTTIDSSYFGVQFLQVEKKVYLKIQSLIRRLELRFAALKETLFLYRNQLIWSGLDQDDTSLLYSFFRVNYWPQLKSSLNTSTIRYLTVESSASPTDALLVSTNLTSQELFLGDLSLPYQIVAINFNWFTIFCVFHNDEELSNMEQTLEKIELLKKDLDEILPYFEECSRKKYPATDPSVKNIYFNKMNMAHSSTMDWNREPTNNILISIMNTLAEDLQWFHPSGDIMVKRENDPWIIAKRSDMRELLIMINQKNANLKEISDKIKQIFPTQFSNILLLE
ncbi:unnamed protein product [Rotaria socialis]|uniref:Uncharacterized protein n=1 Tax=Rotaria socialis TaxID=392032 RepID=A0A820NN33_9BILA|nr:unnamed protein product [Rotaria socialis]CAF3340973.1 unnamed protein product [Rotaria socialis]CAF3360371.1 unnamed protein product [Rotaria socialis]CAF3372020.1 unnamed protein product [Rotaria socialis]CAF4393412.1 unnamed protein product [Rotaria socialis]